jgi:hypothetical protein
VYYFNTFLKQSSAQQQSAYLSVSMQAHPSESSKKHAYRWLTLLSVGVYVEPGPDRDALTDALAKESYIPVYLDPKTVSAWLCS